MYGQVKTRLASTIGHENALDIYHKLLCITRATSLQLICKRHLFYSHQITRHDEWANADFKKYNQTGDNLGQRMKNAFAHIFNDYANQHVKAIIIGSDCPEINVNILEKAYTNLAENDVVIGPSKDGGYYLLGMSQPHTTLFDGIAWSTDTVLTATLHKAAAQHLQVSLLPALSDLDNENDLIYFRSKGVPL